MKKLNLINLSKLFPECKFEFGDKFNFYSPNIIHVSLVENLTPFETFVHHYYPELNEIPIEIIAVLHEIGHYHTLMSYSQEQMNTFADMLARLFMKKDELDNMEYMERYMGIPSEQDATEWAFDYAINHQDELHELII